jgi:hypothetical protein
MAANRQYKGSVFIALEYDTIGWYVFQNTTIGIEQGE